MNKLYMKMYLKNGESLTLLRRKTCFDGWWDSLSSVQRTEIKRSTPSSVEELRWKRARRNSEFSVDHWTCPISKGRQLFVVSLHYQIILTPIIHHFSACFYQHSLMSSLLCKRKSLCTSHKNKECWNYFIAMGTSSWKGLLWLSLPEGSDGIFWNWHRLLRELPFSAEATTQRRREFSSPVNFRRMCWFLDLAVP